MRLTGLILAFTLAALAARADEIAFVDLLRGNGGAVCVIDTENTTVRQLGPGKSDGAPRWSPDGRWLAFESNTETGRGIFLVRADGTEGRAIGSAPWSTAPAWFPDGTRLAYSAAPAPGAPAQVIDLELNSGRETPWAAGAFGIAQPSWLPFTGLMLALAPGKFPELPGVNVSRLREEARMRDEDLKADTQPLAILALRFVPHLAGETHVVKTEPVLISRSEVLPLLALPELKWSAAGAVLWGIAPNWEKPKFDHEASREAEFGTPLREKGATMRIAIESNDGGDREILMIHKRGMVNLSNHRAADWNPVWSPDGDNLAFESFRGGSRGVYNVYADTAHVTPIAVADNADSWSPAWSPDGKRVVFVSDREGAPALFTVVPGESDWEALATGGSPAAPAWRPEAE